MRLRQVEVPPLVVATPTKSSPREIAMRVSRSCHWHESRRFTPTTPLFAPTTPRHAVAFCVSGHVEASSEDRHDRGCSQRVLWLETSERPMTMRWIWLVPSKICITFASRR
jgi:hypothetical protein